MEDDITVRPAEQKALADVHFHHHFDHAA